jgi:hypothetical protein
MHFGDRVLRLAIDGPIASISVNKRSMPLAATQHAALNAHLFAWCLASGNAVSRQTRFIATFIFSSRLVSPLVCHH